MGSMPRPGPDPSSAAAGTDGVRFGSWRRYCSRCDRAKSEYDFFVSCPLARHGPVMVSCRAVPRAGLSLGHVRPGVNGGQGPAQPITAAR
ncbi:hypothetical protein NL676_001284 [Syzygium grande]|nr:hypothetical protein NL676_001284 [Syzygium grande]